MSINSPYFFYVTINKYLYNDNTPNFASMIFKGIAIIFIRLIRNDFLGIIHTTK